MKISGVAAGGASSFAAESRGRGQLVLRRGFGHLAIAAGWIGLIPSRGSCSLATVLVVRGGRLRSSPIWMAKVGGRGGRVGNRGRKAELGKEEQSDWLGATIRQGRRLHGIAGCMVGWVRQATPNEPTPAKQRRKKLSAGWGQSPFG